MSENATNQEALVKQAEAVQDHLFKNVYIPAFIEQFNEKAASAGLTKIASDEALSNALNLVQYIEANSDAKQVDTLSKAASLLDQPSDDTRALTYAAAAAQDPNLLAAIKSLSAE